MNYHKAFVAIILGTAFHVLGCGADSHPPLQARRPTAPQKMETAPPSEGVHFLTDYPKALALSAQTDKPLLVFFTLPGCASSQKMLETTFGDEEIQKLSQRFICVLVDGAKETDSCKSNDIKSFPTILFFSPQRQELERLSGNQTPDQLALQMHVMIQSTAVKLGAIVRQ